MSVKTEPEVRMQLPELDESAMQAVVNQTILSVAERFGPGLGKRPSAPIRMFSKETEAARLREAHDLANGIQHRFGYHHYERHTVTYLFGAPMKALRHPETPTGLSMRQASLIIGIERFAASTGTRHEKRPHFHLKHEPLYLSVMDAAELAVTRCQLGTHRHEGWRHLHFEDSESLQRLQVAMAFAPIITKDVALDFASSFYGYAARKGGAA